MRSRNRLPTIFSLSMLDVLCCGLGAVIFLMILYSWDARRQSKELATQSKALVAAQEDVRRQSKALVEARERIGETSRDRDEKQSTLTTVEKELAATRAALVIAQHEKKEEQENNTRLQARLQAAANAHADAVSQLARAEADLKRMQRALALKTEEHSTVQTEVGALLFDLAKERALLEATKGNLAEAKRSLLATASRLLSTDKQLTEAEKLADLVPGLRAQVAAATRRIRDLEGDATGQKRSLLTLQERLALTEKQKTAAETTAALAPMLREQLAASAKRLKDLDAEVTQLRKQADDAAGRAAIAQKQLDNVKQEMGALRRQLGEEQTSAGVLRRQLVEADGRFAGIDLGGRRVILLVDMSGSMGLSQGDTGDPNKWPEVCKTVGQVLGSLPHAEKFQVILFSNGVQYPLGRPGQWLDVDKSRSPVEVRDALLRVKPNGDTNLYAGFEAAYRLKPQGLDTIYLFSDGLPNTGPGLPNPPPKDETAVASALGKHLRDAINGQWNRGGTKVRIHAVGFFYESPSLGAFLWSLTRENGGSFVGMNRP